MVLTETSYAGAIGTAGAVQYAVGTDGRILGDNTHFVYSVAVKAAGILTVNNLVSSSATKVPNIGTGAGASQFGANNIAIGSSAGAIQSGDCIAIGGSAGGSQTLVGAYGC